MALRAGDWIEVRVQGRDPCDARQERASRARCPSCRRCSNTAASASWFTSARTRPAIPIYTMAARSVAQLRAPRFEVRRQDARRLPSRVPAVLERGVAQARGGGCRGVDQRRGYQARRDAPRRTSNEPPASKRCPARMGPTYATSARPRSFASSRNRCRGGTRRSTSRTIAPAT